MIVSITGHSKGIGKSLASVFSNNGWEVLGFSRSNGYDISKDEDRKKIINESLNADLFINNAYDSNGQYMVLEEILTSWANTKKSVINISSIVIKDYFTYKNLIKLDTEFKNDLIVYYESKKRCSDMIKDYRGSVKILDVFPGLIETEFGDRIKNHFGINGMNPDDFSNLIFDMLKYQNSVYLREISVDYLKK